MTVDLFRQARLPLDQACWQAGVDLGTVVKEYDDAFKSLKSQKGKNKRKKGPSGADADLAKSGPQIRPKRRLPVSQVLLVGGATRMPAVRRFVKNMTGLEPKPGLVDPDLAVAYGAAVQAGIYEGSVQDLMIIDVWQASLMRAYAKLVQENKESDGNDEEGDEEGSADWTDEELGETVDEN
jgi:heat shock protein 1/8